MYDPADPLYSRVQSVALSFPSAAEKVSHGRAAFFTTKVFGYWSWFEKADDGDWIQHPRALVIKPSEDERMALLEEGAWLPPYLASAGWVVLDIESGWISRIEELLDMSYRTTASARLVRERDQAMSLREGEM